MSKLINNHNAFLTLTAETSSKTQRKALLDTATKEQVIVLSEIAHNLLQGNIQLGVEQKTQLRKYKSLYRKLGQHKGSISSRKRIICHNYLGVAKLLRIALSFLRKHGETLSTR